MQQNFTNKSVYVSQGDSKREKEIAEKYKQERNESEVTRYEKRYKRKVESKCEGEYFSILH
jgi:Mor family transcriptional regulator